MDSQNKQEWFEKLPSWAQILVGGGALIGGLWLSAKSAEIEQAERQRKVQRYIKEAEQDISELIALEYSEAVAIMRDSIPRMDAEYWRFYEARLSTVATTYKIRNLHARALELREGSASPFGAAS